jgi:hypothetical protein
MKLDSNFAWTDNYKKQLLELNQIVMNGFSKALDEANIQFLILKERLNYKDSYFKDFNIEIILEPYIPETNKYKGKYKKREEGIYTILNDMLPDILLSYSLDDEYKRYMYDNENYNVNKYLGKRNFKDNFICRAMFSLIYTCKHILSWYDILKINEISIKARVIHHYNYKNIGKGIFWDESIQSLSDNEAENIRQEYMSRLSPDMSGIPIEIFVDEVNTWEKIGPFRRIKFQGSKSKKADYRTLYSMSIEKEPRILVKNANIDLTDEELQIVKDFVTKNRKLLIRMAKEKISISDFAEKKALVK